jgi:hypothetical protein
LTGHDSPLSFNIASQTDAKSMKNCTQLPQSLNY